MHAFHHATTVLQKGALPLLLVLGVGLSTTGCVQTAMLPANQLEEGTTTASFSATEPGALVLPQLQVQATHGVGGGDLSANLSATPGPNLLAVGGGLAGRTYLSDDLNVEAQLQVTSFAGGEADGRRTAGLALVGVQTVPNETGSWYYGAQGGVVRGPSPDVYAGSFAGAPPRKEVPIWTDPVIGGTVGYGPIEVGPSTRMQIELEANLPIWGAKSEPPMPTTGVSMGLYGLFQ